MGDGETLNNDRSMKDVALLYASYGYRVFPVYEIDSNGHCSCKKGEDCKTPGKHPRILAWNTDATTDPEKVRDWWGKHANANIGIATGIESGIVVIDIDGEAGQKRLEEFEEEYGALPETLKVKSGRDGGIHLYYQFSSSLSKTGVNQDIGIDVRSDRGYIVAPPSMHKTGKRYAALQESGLLCRPNELGLLSEDLASNLPRFLYPDAKRNTDSRTPTIQINQQIDPEQRQELLDLLLVYADQGGFDNYDEWLKLGGALKNAGFVCDDWAHLSWPDAESECLGKWASLPSKRITLGTLIYWARKINPGFLRDNRTTSVDSDHELMSPEVFKNEKECMEFFDSKYYKATVGNRTVVLDRNHAMDTNMSKNDFFDLFSGKQLMWPKNKNTIEKISAARHWFKYTKFVYRHVLVDPDPNYKQKSGDINLWKGFAFSPRQNGKAQSFLQFIEDVICNKNKANFEYLMDILAQMFQEPHRKQGVGIAIALRGIQGIGKSFFAESIGRLLGEAFVTVESVEMITGRFNSVLMGKILVFGDEALWGGDRPNKDKLKSMITSSSLNIEKKFKDTFEAKNYCRYIFAANSDWAAPVEKNDRRYFVLDVSPIHARDTKYFAAIHADLKEGGYADLLQFLLARDYSTRDFQSELPVTEGAKENLLKGFSNLESWLYNALSFDEMPNGGAPLLSFGSCIPVDDVYLSYKKYAEENGGYKERRETLGVKLRKIFPTLQQKKVTIKDAKVRKNHYVLPPFHDARKDFETYVGFSSLWDDEEYNE